MPWTFFVDACPDSRRESRTRVSSIPQEIKHQSFVGSTGMGVQASVKDEPDATGELEPEVQVLWALSPWSPIPIRVRNHLRRGHRSRKRSSVTGLWERPEWFPGFLGRDHFVTGWLTGLVIGLATDTGAGVRLIGVRIRLAAQRRCVRMQTFA